MFLHMTRHEARVTVFTLIYESFFRMEDTVSEVYSYESEMRGFSSNQYISTVFYGAQEKARETDGLISEYAENWSINRISSVTKAILRLALYEMIYTETPPKVAINEAVEIAKEYAEDSAPGFINGILNRIAKDKELFSSENAESEASESDGQ